ncbi:MAG: glycosyltransferase, partial [Candidatus Thermoplasmatota archaeon]|nr:glycosyltransferase [Candidatus Thermoplasmatota archaeon]
MRIFLFGSNRSVHVRNWSSWLAARGHDVRIVTYEPGRVGVGGVAEDYFPVSGLFMRVRGRIPGRIRRWLEARQLARLRALKPDIVHVHYITDTGAYAVEMGVHPLVMSAYGSDIALDPFRFPEKLEQIRSSLAAADMVHSNGEEGRERLLELGCSTEKIVVQPWGVDVNRFSPEARNSDIRNNLLG